MFQSVDDAVSGIAYPGAVPSVNVCTPVDVEVTIANESPPLVDVARVCDATVLPLRLVIVPPAPPASVPQVKVPFAHMSFSVDELHAVKLAPKSAVA